MGCDIQKDSDGQVMRIVCSRGGKRCRWCGKPCTKLCDFALPNGTTCDAPMCTEHAIHRGIDVDFCPDHGKAAELVRG